jgi:hypothetical protein
MVANYPNFYCVLGPNAPLGGFLCFRGADPKLGNAKREQPTGSNSALPIIERTVKYIFQHVLAMQAYSIRSIAPKEKDQNDWFWWGQEWLKKSVWASRGCGGWYKKPRAKGQSHEVTDGGIIQAIYPGTTNSFLRFISGITWKHFDVEFEAGKVGLD